jgi:hypothetical protein
MDESGFASCTNQTSSGFSHPPDAYTVQPMVGSIDGLELPHASNRTTHQHERFFVFSI